MNKKRSLFVFAAIALIPLIVLGQITGGPNYSSVIMSFLRSTTAAAARSAIGAANSGSGGTLTNAVLYGSTSGNWTVGSTANLTADTARTITTTTGALTLSSGSSHIVLSPSSSVGIGTTGPDAKLDVLSTGGSQYRATYTDGSVYSDWGTLSSGITQWTNSLGHRMESSIVNNSSVLSRPMRGGLAFDGVTSTQGISEPCGSVTTTDFTLDAIFLTPTSSSATYPVIQLKPSNSKTTEVTSLVVSIVSGSLVVQIIGPGATTDWRKATLTSFVTNYGGRVVHVAVTRTGTTFALYVNGVAQTVSETTNGTDPTWAGSVVSSFVWVGSQDTNYFNSTVYAYRVHTRVLSASEVVTLANNGVQEPDKWASLTAKYTSDFSVNTDSFTAVNGTVTGNVDGIGGQNDNLSYYGDATVGNHAAARSTTVMTGGRKYRVQYSYYIPSANTNIKKLACFSSGGSSIGDSVRSVTDAWTSVSFETSALTSSTYGLGFYTYNASDSTSFACANSPTNDLFYIRGITVTQIGCLLDPDLAIGVGYQAPDRSSNKYHGTLSATGVSHVIDQRRGQIRYTTTGATTGAFQLLSGTAIPANALIQSIVAWSAGTPLIYVGTATGTSNIVGHTTLTGSTYTPLTLAAQFSTTGNLWINKSATNEVNLTVNYMMVDP
jgi:hypothetical protein